MNDIPSGFEPDFPGDNPSRQWVRRKGLEKFGEEGVRRIAHEAAVIFIRDSDQGVIHEMFRNLMQDVLPDGIHVYYNQREVWA